MALSRAEGERLNYLLRVRPNDPQVKRLQNKNDGIANDPRVKPQGDGRVAPQGDGRTAPEGIEWAPTRGMGPATINTLPGIYDPGRYPGTVGDAVGAAVGNMGLQGQPTVPDMTAHFKGNLPWMQITPEQRTMINTGKWAAPTPMTDEQRIAANKKAAYNAAFGALRGGNY